MDNWQTHINHQLTIDRVKFLTDIPTYWPVPQQKMVYVVDLRDPKFGIIRDTGELLSADALIKNKVSLTLLLESCGSPVVQLFTRIKIHGLVALMKGIQNHIGYFHRCSDPMLL